MRGRRFAIAFIVMLLPGLTTAPTAGTQTSDGMILMALDVTVGEPSEGWSSVSVDIGLRNDTPSAVPVDFPAGDHGSVAIEEGYVYDVSLGWGGRPADEPFIYDYRAMSPTIGAFYRFQLPPGFAFCGMVVSDDADSTFDVSPLRLTAAGDIPEQTVPAQLGVIGFPVADLTTPVDAVACEPQTSGLPPLSTELLLDPADPGSPLLNLSLTPVGESRLLDRAIIKVAIENRDRFGDLHLNDLMIWAVYDDGVWVSPPPIDDDCAYLPLQTSLGPGQSGTIELCMPNRSIERSLRGVIVSSQTYGFYQALQVPAADAAGGNVVALPGDAEPGTVLYQADANGGFEEWSNLADGWRVSDGLLHYDSTSGQGGLITAPVEAIAVQDYAIEAEFRVTRPAPVGDCNQIFGVAGRIGPARSYWAGASCGRNWSVDGETEWAILWRTDNVPIWSLQNIFGESLTVTDFAPGTEWHRYRLEVHGSQLRLFIDDVLVLEATDDQIPSGEQVGLFATMDTLNRSFAVAVRLFRVTTL